MKNTLLFLLAVSPFVTNAQEKEKNEPVKESGLNNRISFIAGPGASYITRDIYDNPVISQATNAVIIEEASKIKTNLALGIIYTPYIYDITRTVSFLKQDGTIGYRNEIERVPKGQTFAAFINPLAFSKTSETQSFFSMVDFGVGYGYRSAGGLLLMATTEFFSVRQPRQWFIDAYKDKSLPYSIGGAAQKAIDMNDNSIFTNKSVLTFGFKICYTFDIVKSYLSGAERFSSNTETNPKKGDGNDTPPSPPVVKP